MPAIRVAAAALAAFVCFPAFAIEPGFVLKFQNAGDTGSFFGGSSAGTLYTNPGTGGVDGVNDGFLRIENFNLGHFGGYTQLPQFQGDWLSAGVARLEISMKNISGSNFHMHVCIGNSNQNMWQLNTVFSPGAEWETFVVDFENIVPSEWTRIRGSGTLLQALSDADRLLLRHDIAPYTPTPNPIIGVLGVDNIRIVAIPAPSAAALLAMGGLMGLRRRR